MHSRTVTKGQVAALALAGLLATTQSSVAAPDPDKTFFQNFLAPAYYMPIYPLDGKQFGGDLTATYDQAYVRVVPSTELLIIGEFPRARYFAITLYDDHGAIIATLRDHELEPLKASQVNPYRPGGTPGAQDILYAVRVQLGNSLATTPVAGCQIDNLNITSNVLDGRFRHTAGTRYSAYQSQYTATNGVATVVHDDVTANGGVSVVVRRYLEEPDGETGALNLTTPVIFVRQVTNGCALNLWDLIGEPQPDPPVTIPPAKWYTFPSTVDLVQIAGHDQHSKDMPIRQPYGFDPNNRLTWYAGPEWILTTNPDTGYLSAGIPAAAKPATLNAAGKVMRMRFRLPQTPCRDEACALTGNEQMRYWGLSFVVGERTVAGSISDLDVNPNASGYVDLIITFGTPLPAWVTPANGYSVVEMAPDDIRLVTLRNILPGPGFGCAVNNVPFKTNEHHSNGGYMGEYAPFVTLPDAATLPQNAVPLVQGGDCAPP